MNRKVVGYFLIGAGVIMFVSIFYFNSKYKNITRPFSPYTLLTSSWEKYKNKFINKDGRVVDYSSQDITTSEGQSYALLRAVFVDDKPTFDLVWKWTSENLKRPNDNLLGWRWGLIGNREYGFMPNGGDNSASDADSDTALALILASRRWRDPTYKEDAIKILNDMWALETDTANSKRYLIAGNWAKNSSELIINPSYLAPYAWRIFAIEDTKHDWQSLITPAYDLLQNSGTASLDKNQGSGLPPDWVAVNKATGNMGPANINGLNSNYSFDAIRVPWRIALDYQWNSNDVAKQYLLKSFKTLDEIYTTNNQLPSSLSHDGTVTDSKESPAMYATAIGYFMVANPGAALDIYQNKIIRLYSNDTNTFNDNLPYYEQNWLWFGVALFNKFLINYS